MRLEDEIKQTKPFKNEMQKLVLNISVTSSWLNSIFVEKLKPYDISPPQYNVLRILKGKHPDCYCNQEITQRMIDKSSNATRIVDKLVDKKLVSRTEDKGDRRLVNIKITDKGIKLLAEIDKQPFSENTKMKNFNEEKAKLMNEWLDELRG
jgi:DNA-binding MarR family transcriptional regulator